MKFWKPMVAVILMSVTPLVSYAASVIVVPAGASEKEKAYADFICDGVNDQVELMASFGGAGSLVERRSVVWLPGDYYTTRTVIIPPTNNVVLEAEGTYIHHLLPYDDAVRIDGFCGSRFRFGTIETYTIGAAIRFKLEGGGGVMSIISFTGLIGHDQKGTGLFIHCENGGTTNRYEGLEITGFEYGVVVGETYTSKSDTNWFFINCIRNCKTCIWEMHQRLDCMMWRVGLDTSLPNSVGIRTGGYSGRFDVMMNDSCGLSTKAVILDAGARGNVFEIQPPIDDFKWEDNSSGGENVILTTTKYSDWLKKHSQEQIQENR